MELKRLAEMRKKKEEDAEEENKDTETAKTSKNNEKDNVEQDTIKTDKTESNGHEKSTKTSDAEEEGSDLIGVEIEVESLASSVDINSVTKKKNM